uniref:Fmp27_GFWDK domain-containing protein n=1 Tax=Macrostomum lignano TaxID=282301 RepID=A0A1I8FQE7_9PLAT
MLQLSAPGQRHVCKFITNKLLVSNQAGQSNEDMVRLLLMNSRIGAARLQLNQRTSDGSPVSVQCRVAEPRFFVTQGLHEAEAADNSAIPVVAGGGARPPASASIDEEGSPLFWLPRRAELQIDALHCELEREMCRRSLVLEWSALSAKLQNDTAAEERDGGGGGRNSIASLQWRQRRLLLLTNSLLYPKVIDFKLALLTAVLRLPKWKRPDSGPTICGSVLPRSLAALTTRRRPLPTPSPAPAAAVTSSPRRRRQRLRARLGRLLGSKADRDEFWTCAPSLAQSLSRLRVTYGPTKLDLVLDTHGGYRPPVACQIQCASCDLQGPLCVQLSNQNPAHMRVLDSSLANALEIDSCHITCPKLSGQSSDALQTKLTVSRCQLKVTSRELVQTLTQLVHAWAASFAPSNSPEQQQQQQPNRQPQPPLLAFRRPAILLPCLTTRGHPLDLELRSHQHQHHIQQTGFGGATVSMDLKLLKVLHYSSCWLRRLARAFWSPGVHLCLKDIHEHCLAPILKLMHPAEITRSPALPGAKKPRRFTLIAGAIFPGCRPLSPCLRRLIDNRVGLNVPENKVYTTAMDTLLFGFHLKFDFLRVHGSPPEKWLRSVHNHTDKDLIEDDSVPLGPDICVNIGSLTIELHDDPFELNLSENYLLMLDECLETEERILIAQAMARRAGHLDRDKTGPD